MTSSRALDRERKDLEDLFGDLVVAAFGEQAEAVGTGSEPDADLVDGPAALVAVHDEGDDTYLGVHVRVSPVLARLLATRLLECDDPAREDLLDAAGRFADLAAEHVQTLLFPGTRLSLPSATLDEAGLPPARQECAPTVLRALVLGEVAELALIPYVDGDALVWPPVPSDLLEPQP